VKVKEMYQRLLEDGQIYYGATISAESLYKLIEHKPEDGWPFLGPYLQLKELIEEDGHFCTSQGCPQGALRILPLERMTERVDSLQKVMIRRQKKAMKSMRQAAYSDLGDIEYRQHMHAMNKLAIGLHALKSVLND